MLRLLAAVVTCVHCTVKWYVWGALHNLLPCHASTVVSWHEGFPDPPLGVASSEAVPAGIVELDSVASAKSLNQPDGCMSKYSRSLVTEKFHPKGWLATVDYPGWQDPMILLQQGLSRHS